MPSRLAILAAALLALQPAPQPPSGSIIVADATVIDGTGAPPARHSLLITGGTITAVLQPGAKPPDGATVVDGRGRFVIPGLWDMHVHLGVRPEPELAERIMLPVFLAYGIVGVRDMGGPLERVVTLRD